MSTELPTLAVVVPCYNEEDTIADCLEALVAQPDIKEIVLVDNNSSDGTPQIIAEYGKKYSQIRLVVETKRGVQFARNAGLDAATADVIARIDADTIVQDGWARALRDYYAQNPKVGAASGYSWYYDLPFQKLTQYFTELFAHAANRKLADSHLIYGANMSLRRSAWQAIRSEVCMRSGIMEDQDLGYHVVRGGFGTGYVPDAQAKVSGRRMRMSPLRYWRYNKQWWMTYYNHGQTSTAMRIRVMAWIGNVLQALAWAGLQFHDPVQRRFSMKYFFTRKHERQIP